MGLSVLAVTAAASAATFSTADFLGGDDFFILGDVDLVPVFALLILPSAAAAALLFFATAKVPS